MIELINQFKTVYHHLNADNVDSLAEVYAAELTFIDPFHRIDGLDAFKAYIRNLYANVSQCRFEFGEPVAQSLLVDSPSQLRRVYLDWTMTFCHPRLNKGQPISVPGVSQLQCDEKIIRHQDFFDGGALLYQHIPVLGQVIKRLKRRMM